MKIAIVGLGYVGLPLALQFARKGVQVLGLYVYVSKVDVLNAARYYIKHIEATWVEDVVKAGRLVASTDFSQVRSVEAVIICVPTPLNKNQELDIYYVLNSGQTIASLCSQAFWWDWSRAPSSRGLVRWT